MAVAFSKGDSVFTGTVSADSLPDVSSDPQQFRQQICLKIGRLLCILKSKEKKQGMFIMEILLSTACVLCNGQSVFKETLKPSLCMEWGWKISTQKGKTEANHGQLRTEM